MLQTTKILELNTCNWIETFRASEEERPWIGARVGLMDCIGEHSASSTIRNRTFAWYLPFVPSPIQQLQSQTHKQTWPLEAIRDPRPRWWPLGDSPSLESARHNGSGRGRSPTPCIQMKPPPNSIGWLLQTFRISPPRDSTETRWRSQIDGLCPPHPTLGLWEGCRCRLEIMVACLLCEPWCTNTGWSVKQFSRSQLEI